MAREYGFRADGGGLVVAAYSIAAGAAALLAGPPSDRLGHRSTLRGGLALFAAGGAASALAPSLSWLAAARTLSGAGAGLVSLAVIAYVSVAIPYARRGKAMGTVQSGHLVALLAGVPAGALLADLLGVRALFLSTGALAVIFLAGLARLPGDPPSKSASSHGDLLRFLRESGPRRGAGIAFLAALGLTGAVVFFGAFLVGTFDLRTTHVGALFALAGVAPLVAGPLTGGLADRLGKRRVAALSGIGLAASLAALPALGGSLPAAVAAFFAAVFFESARRGPLQAFYTGLVPLERVAAFTAVKNAAAQIGSAAAAALAALVFDRPGGFAWICAGSAAATLLSATLLRSAPDPVR